MNTTEKFLRDINEAFASNNSGFIIENVTEDIEWSIVGDSSIKGKENFKKTLKDMEVPENMKLEISNILVQEEIAVVEGYIDMGKMSGKLKKYAFCDIYKLTGKEKPKIKELISYVIELK